MSHSEKMRGFGKKTSRKFGKNYSSHVLETLKSDLEAEYNQAVSQLREKFPTIPEDLNNKRVTIRYKQDNGVYQNIFLYSDRLAVDKINGKNIVINKIKGERRGVASSTQNGMIIIENFYTYELEQGINKIIENADKCEIDVEELDQPRLPVDE